MNPVWTADQRLYLNRRGEVRHEGDTDIATLLCGVGAKVPDDVCKRHGIGPYAETGHPVETDHVNAGDPWADAAGSSARADQSAAATADPPQNGSESDSERVAETPPDRPVDPDPGLKPRRRK